MYKKLINGIPVDFPFEPYGCQMTFMERVIETLNGESNAMLESPTGTGKTLCLLSATLSWRREFQKRLQEGSEGGPKKDVKAEIPTIFYATRTHSQINQVFREFKKLKSFENLQVRVLGGRNHYCVNEYVSPRYGSNAAFSSRVQIMAQCNSLVKSRKCIYHANVQDNKNTNVPMEDIEDLVRWGEKTKVCPYFYSRETLDKADIVFMPYNYVIDPSIREVLGSFLFEKSIVILDEAHNIESVATTECSFELSTDDIQHCIDNLRDTSEFMDQMSFDENAYPEDVRALADKVQELLNCIHQLPLSNGHFVDNGTRYLEMISQLELDYPLSVDAILLALSFNAKYSRESKNTAIAKFGDSFKLISRFRKEQIHECYKMIVQLDTVKRNQHRSIEAQQDTRPPRKFQFWCFDPGLAMGLLELSGVRNMIITSGTLSPLNSLESELSVNFPVKLENGHVITKNQLWIGVIGKSPDGTSVMSSSFTNRTSKYYVDVGITIASLLPQIPDGVLVFFPSYSMLEDCVDQWERNMMGHDTIMNAILKHKHVVTEPKDSSKLKDKMQTHYDNVLERNGSIFFAVCRGKVSEGLDFSDRFGRAVFIVGIPYPSFVDIKIKLKKEFLDKKKSRIGSKVCTSVLTESRQLKFTKGISGNEWYNQNGWRAVNQAIGRILRHKDDYGAIILVDDRFNYQSDNLSKWVRSYITKQDNIEIANRQLSRFFSQLEGTTKKKTYTPTKDSILSGFIPSTDSKLTSSLSNKSLSDKITQTSHSSFERLGRNIETRVAPKIPITRPLKGNGTPLKTPVTPGRNKTRQVLYSSPSTLSINNSTISTHSKTPTIVPLNTKTTMITTRNPSNNPVKLDPKPTENLKENNTHSESKQTPQDNAHHARRFLEMAKSEFGESKYSLFRNFMLQYKSKKMTRDELCSRVFDLIGDNEELKQAFSAFVPNFTSNSQTKDSEVETSSSNVKRHLSSEEPPSYPAKKIKNTDDDEIVKSRMEKTRIDISSDVSSSNTNTTSLTNTTPKSTSPKRKSPTKINLLTGQKMTTRSPLILNRPDISPKSVSLDVDDENICFICMTNYKQVTLSTCKHSFCKECLEKIRLIRQECPVCRRRIREKNIVPYETVNTSKS